MPSLVERILGHDFNHDLAGTIGCDIGIITPDSNVASTGLSNQVKVGRLQDIVDIDVEEDITRVDAVPIISEVKPDGMACACRDVRQCLHDVTRIKPIHKDIPFGLVHRGRRAIVVNDAVDRERKIQPDTREVILLGFKRIERVRSVRKNRSATNSVNHSRAVGRSEIGASHGVAGNVLDSGRDREGERRTSHHNT